MAKSLSGFDSDQKEWSDVEAPNVAPTEAADDVPTVMTADTAAEPAPVDHDGDWFTEGDAVHVLGLGGRHDPSAMPIQVQGVLKSTDSGRRFYIVPAMDGSTHSVIVRHEAVRKVIVP